MPKRNGSSLTGPLRLTRQNGTDKRVEGRKSTVSVSALTTNTAETYTITDSDARLEDIIVVSPAVAPQAGWGIEAAWVDAAGSIKIRARNHSGSTLTAGSLVLCYQIIK